MSTRTSLGDAGVRAAFSRAASRYAGAAAMQRRVCDGLLERLPSGQRIARALDLGCGTGFASAGLQARCAPSGLIAADFSIGMLAAHQAGAGVPRVCADAHRLPFAEGCFDLVFSSLMLQWCALDLALPECRRVLAPGGRLAFSTVLAGTLGEIEQAFRGLDAHRHVIAFPSASDLDTALTGAGLRIERMDLSTETEHFADARALLQSNRDIGASRVPDGGRRTVLGRAALQTVLARLEALRSPEGLPLSYRLAWVVATPAGATGEGRD